VLSLLEAPRRCECRGAALKPERSPPYPTTLPISVDVRSIDWMPGGAVYRSSCRPASPGCLLVAREAPDMLEARLLRPLTGPLASLLFSMALLQPSGRCSVRA
jgi:hypothetical protein